MHSSHEFDIRAAIPDDAPLLPAIENAAGTLFRDIPELSHLVDGDDQPVEQYREWILSEASWVAVDPNGLLVGFLTSTIEQGVMHIWELGVHAKAQRKGLGRALVERAMDFACSRSCTSVTLTTFRDVPWNAPFYQTMGFAIIDAREDERLSSIIRDEASHGLRQELRVAMRLPLHDGGLLLLSR